MKTLKIRESAKKADRDSRTGFTMIELLVSMTILSVLLLMLTQLLTQVQNTWSYSESRISQFREARVAFDIISKNLSQATMNTYWDYEYDRGNQVKRYRRQSELHFLTLQARDLDLGKPTTTHAIFFQAPLGFSSRYRNLDNLFNGRGYFVAFSDDLDFKPQFIKAEPKFRFRLMEYRAPAEENQVFVDGDEERQADREQIFDWWYQYEQEKYSYPLAENIIALIISPRETLEDSRKGAGGSVETDTFSSIAPEYTFDSNDRTKKAFTQMVPPLVKLTMVAIDENSAVRLEAQYGRSMPDLVPNSLFRNTRDYQRDLDELKKDLIDANVNFKVFSTMVAIRSAKWNTLIPQGDIGS